MLSTIITGIKIYDISQEVFGCDVYPGDPIPQKQRITSMEKGDLYNLTSFSMCAHNGTHIDAPRHFIRDGKAVDGIDLEKTVGYACVTELDGDVDEEIAREIIRNANALNPESAKRILFRGDAVITEAGARTFAVNGVCLVGVESRTVGPADAPMAVHLTLLKNEVVLLEGIRLKDVRAGVYLLNAAPLNLGGSDGAPCRALLIEF